MKVYMLKVYLGKKIKKRPQSWRLIEIGGDDTLANLHDAIFDAYNRRIERYSEFIIRREIYLFPTDSSGEFESALFTDIDTLNLSPGDSFRYLFDYMTEVWHMVEVINIEDRPELKEFSWRVVEIHDTPFAVT